MTVRGSMRAVQGGSQRGGRYYVRAGDTRVGFEAPPFWEVEEVAPGHLPPLDPAEALDQALRHPLGCPPLRLLARGCRRAVLVIPDHTRPGPEPELLPVLRDALLRYGVGELRLLIGTGLHRPMAEAEILGRHGPLAAVENPARNHHAGEPALLRRVGETREGIPAEFHVDVVEADLVLSTGLVEPHQYAGFSGGYKAVAVGAAGERSIQATHRPSFLARAGVALGRLEGNPFQAALAELGRLAGHRFCVNYVGDDRGRIVGLAAGEPGEVVRHLAEHFRPFWFAHLRSRFSAAVVGVPGAKSHNLYQSSRAASYLAAGEPPVLEEGATIILATPCPEGTGSGAGEIRFYQAMTSGLDPSSLCRRLLDGETRGGEQRAWSLARVLQRFRVVVAGSTLSREAVERAGMEWAGSVQEAVDREASRRPRARCLVLPDPFHRLPEWGL